MARCLAAVLALPLLACGAGVETYFPLKGGRIWTYRVEVEGHGRTRTLTTRKRNLYPRMINEDVVSPQLAEVQGDERSGVLFFYGVDGGGLFLYARQGYGDVEPQVYARRGYELKQPLTPGTAWETDLEYASLLAGQRVETVATSHVIESTREQVSVPAGTFEGCLRVRHRSRFRAALDSGEEVEIQVDGADWYAPEVGVVKSSWTEKGALRPDEVATATITSELVAYR